MDYFDAAESVYEVELDFGNNFYAIPGLVPVQQPNNNPTVLDVPSPSPMDDDKALEDSRIKALVEAPALDWSERNDPGKDYGKSKGVRINVGRIGLKHNTPPRGYICHRCNEPGHYIQHCPTNGDPDYNVKRLRVPTGVPKSLLKANPEGNYALPNGTVAVLEPDEAAFDREMEVLGLSSTRPSVRDLIPELHCPLCKLAMKDAMMTRCCFNSFCDKCIREHIISRSSCFCGATNVLTDDLCPNLALRGAITYLQSSSSSSSGRSSGSKRRYSETNDGSEDQESSHSSRANNVRDVVSRPTMITTYHHDTTNGKRQQCEC